ncbi:MAG: phosphoribosylaminoimidazolesuccinocarboxamide synthase [Desulfatiglandales bacterium]
MDQIITFTEFDRIPLFKRGKVRDVYDLGESLLMVATDRISAFDVILPNGIPTKGKVLTQISLFWFEQMKGIVDNHVITADVEEYPGILSPYRELLRGRSMLVKKAKPMPVECIVRGYLSGSGWSDYKGSGKICGITLPEGLLESQKLPEPIFTPSTKAEEGHDINITFEEVLKEVGEKRATFLREKSIEVYKRASEIAEEKGIIIADTKMEFGVFEDRLILIDELLTPDSSRFWAKGDYSPGRPQESFDKQIVRDYLISLNWDKRPPAPTLPHDIVERTSMRYQEILKILTGRELDHS